MTTPVALFVGIDVSKDRLDVAVRPSGERWSVANAPDAFGAFIQRLQALPPTLVVLEATGGLEAAVVAELKQFLPTVNLPPAPGSAQRILEPRDGKWFWEGKEIRPEELDR